MSREARGLPDGTYVELVRSLYGTLVPTLIMAASFTAVGIAVTRQTPDPVLIGLLAAGVLGMAGRIAVILSHRREAGDAALGAARTQTIERRFAAAYLSFALIFGLFSARALWVAPHDARILLMALIFGYGAGVAAGVSLRPWISLPSLLIATTPSMAVAIASDNLMLKLSGFLLAAFLVGAVQSMLARWQTAVARISMSRLFATLARQDALTGLPNRLSLRERFDLTLATSKGGMLAVHCLDLDRFKPVNDRYGHPVGDALLKAVSQRLVGLLREADTAVRLGGDEFVIIQAQLFTAGEAETLAHRIVRAITQPFSIDGHSITIGTSVGYAVLPTDGYDLDQLIEKADEALYAAKNAGVGVAGYGSPEPEKPRSLSA